MRAAARTALASRLVSFIGGSTSLICKLSRFEEENRGVRVAGCRLPQPRSLRISNQILKIMTEIREKSLSSKITQYLYLNNMLLGGGCEVSLSSGRSACWP